MTAEQQLQDFREIFPELKFSAPYDEMVPSIDAESYRAFKLTVKCRDAAQRLYLINYTNYTNPLAEDAFNKEICTEKSVLATLIRIKDLHEEEGTLPIQEPLIFDDYDYKWYHRTRLLLG